MTNGPITADAAGGHDRFMPATSAELAWSIASPPLLTEALAPHAYFSAAACQQLWQDWQPVVDDLAALPTRLGRRFESLWQHWLCEHPRWQLRAAGLLAKHGQQTLGEFDLLVHDQLTGLNEHWELAVKFYLGDGHLDDPANWWGLHRQDRLDRKVHKLQQQLQLAQTEAGKQALQRAGLHVARTRAVIKGRLFYPLTCINVSASFAAPDHLRGRWATVEQWRLWLAQHGDCDCWPLPRGHWLAGFDVHAMAETAWAAQKFSVALQQAGAFDCFGLSSGEVVLVVADDWSQPAMEPAITAPPAANPAG